MIRRRIYKQGNSVVVTLPADILNALDISPGAEVYLQLLQHPTRLIISKHPIHTSHTATIPPGKFTNY